MATDNELRIIVTGDAARPGAAPPGLAPPASSPAGMASPPSPPQPPMPPTASAGPDPAEMAANKRRAQREFAMHVDAYDPEPATRRAAAKAEKDAERDAAAERRRMKAWDASLPKAELAKPKSYGEMLGGAASVLGGGTFGRLAALTNQVEGGLKLFNELTGKDVRQGYGVPVGPPSPNPPQPTGRANQVPLPSGGSKSPAPTVSPSPNPPPGPKTPPSPAAAQSTPTPAGGMEVEAVEEGAAGGPAGLAIAAAIMIGEKIAKMAGDAVRGVANVAERGSAIASTAARGDNEAAVGMAAQGFVDLTKQLPVVGDALGVVGDSAVRVGKAFTGLVDAFVDRGKELADFSGPLAFADAMSDVRKLFGDIREAEVLGPDLAKLTDAQSRLEDDLREILLPIKKAILQKLVPLLDAIDDWLKRHPNLGDNIVNGAEIVGKGAMGAAVAVVNPLAALVLGIRELVGVAKKAQAKAEEPKPDELLNAFLDMLDKAAPRPVGPNQMRLPGNIPAPRPPILQNIRGQ